MQKKVIERLSRYLTLFIPVHGWRKYARKWLSAWLMAKCCSFGGGAA